MQRRLSGVGKKSPGQDANEEVLGEISFEMPDIIKNKIQDNQKQQGTQQ
jgi:hypothetical protein